MTAQFLDTLFLGLLTYLGHSTVFLALGLILTSLGVMKNLSLKEMILRFALFGALITTPLHMSGGFDSFFQPIKLSEKTLKSDPAPLVVVEPRNNKGLPATIPPVTTDTEVIEARDAGSLIIEENPAPSFLTLANIVLMVWAFFGMAFLLQLFYLVIDLKAQLSGRVTLEKGRAVTFARGLATKAGIPTPHVSVKKNLAGPFCLGTGEIVLPEWAEDLPSNQLKAMIAHEVAHIMRADPAWVLAARIVQSVFFFQPLNIFAARKLSELSEFACDAWAGKMCGSGMPLAECLAECVKRQLGKAPSALSTAMATKRSPIVERTQLLLAGIRDYSKPASRLSKVAVISAFVIGGTMIPVFAFDDENDKAKEDALAAEEAAKETKERSESFRTAMAENGTTAASSALASSSSSYIIENRNGEWVIKVSYTDKNSTMKIRGILSRFEINDDETGFSFLDKGCYLDITETIDGVTRRVRFEESGGRVVETFWLNGSKTSKDQDMAEWVAKAIPTMFRQTGLDAERRTKRIYEKGGTNAVLDEFKFIPSSYTLRKYAVNLSKIGKFNDAQVDRLIGSIKDRQSSYDLRVTLTEIATNIDLSKKGWRAFAEAILEIPSSYDRRVTLSNVADVAGKDSETREILIKAVGGVGSDYDKRVTLTNLSEKFPSDTETMKGLASVAKTISSDYDLRVTLMTFAKRGGYDEAGWLALLDAIHEISSDYDARVTLITFAGEMPRTSALEAKYRELLETIGGEYDREQAEKAL